MTPSEIIARLEGHLRAADELSRSSSAQDVNHVQAWMSDVSATLREWGDPAASKRFRDCEKELSPPPQSIGEDVRKRNARVKKALQLASSELKQIRVEIDQHDTKSKVAVGSVQSSAANRSVFVAHGHHQASTQAVARSLTELKLEPILLHERANHGKTIIEKLEENSGVACAVIILSPDDEVRTRGPKGVVKKHHPRQNVVLELGYFIGRIGRAKTMCIVVGDVEIPSELSGVVLIEYDDGGSWRQKLAREVKASGLEVDLNDLR